jgi:acetyl-CoA C-acetyltransferase
MTSVPIGASIRDGAKAGHGAPFPQEINDKVRCAPSCFPGSPSVHPLFHGGAMCVCFCVGWSRHARAALTFLHQSPPPHHHHHHHHPQYGARLRARGTPVFSQFEGAELVAETYGISRLDMEKLAVASHERALRATRAGRFTREIVPLTGKDKEGNACVHDTDEGIRPGTSLAGLAKLTSLKARASKGKTSGLVTAGLASQICDGAAALLICNAKGLKKLGVQPRARFVGLSVAAADPVMMLSGPIPATRKVFAQTGLKMGDMDVYEVNEAFAPVPLAWAKALGADLDKLNVNGGAMALGHPLGGTGAKLMTTLLHELERSGGRYGLQAICEGGGTANATIIERLPTGSKM